MVRFRRRTVQGVTLKVLFTTLPALGHAAPLTSLAAELHGRGHAIVWVADTELDRHLLPVEAARYLVAMPARKSTPPTGRMSASVRTYFTEDLPRAAAAALPTLQRAIAAEAPDLIVTEQNCLAGAIAAELSGCPWVCVHVTPILLRRPMGDLPQLEAWVNREVGRCFQAYGCVPRPWPLRSPHLNLIATAPTLLGADVPLAAQDRVVGALLEHRGRGEELPGLSETPGPRILISLGTLGGGGDGFVQRAVTALRPSGSVIVIGGSVTGATLSAPWADLLACMPQIDLVVTHGGQGTVHEALAHGVPVLCAPMRFDQPAVASRVEALGVGRRVSLDHATVEVIGREAGALLMGASGERARALAAELAVELRGGAARAADLIEEAWA